MSGKKLNKYLFILFALALTACDKGIEITSSPVLMTFNDDNAANSISEYSTITVRTWIKVGDAKAELENVACEIDGLGFYANFTTPARLALPVYKGNTAPISVSCTNNGRTVAVGSLPYNQTAKNKINSAQAGFGIMGAVAAIAVSGVHDTSNDRFLYQDISIYFD